MTLECGRTEKCSRCKTDKWINNWLFGNTLCQECSNRKAVSENRGAGIL